MTCWAELLLAKCVGVLKAGALRKAWLCSIPKGFSVHNLAKELEPGFTFFILSWVRKSNEGTLLLWVLAKRQNNNQEPVEGSSSDESWSSALQEPGKHTSSIILCIVASDFQHSIVSFFRHLKLRIYHFLLLLGLLFFLFGAATNSITAGSRR